MPQSVGVLGHVGNENQGDEALIAATIQNIRSRYPTVRVVGYTIHPRDTETRHGIPAFPIQRVRSNGQGTPSQRLANQPPPARRPSQIRERIKSVARRLPLVYHFAKSIRDSLHRLGDLLLELPFCFRSYHNLKGVDLLIVSGSQQCNDLAGGPWNYPFTLFKWSLLARLNNTKVAFLSVGAGPISSPLSRYFIRQALSLASYCSFRDEESKYLVQKIGVSGDLQVFPDLAYSLNLVTPRSKHAREGRLTVGINPLPLDSPFYWIGHNPAAHCNYVNTLAAFAVWLLCRGYRVVLFPTQLRVDPPVIEELHSATKRIVDPRYEASLFVPRVRSFDDLISTISDLDIAVVTRFHGVVFSYLLHKPVLGIAYHKKTQEMMEKFGQSDYVTDVELLNVDWLIERFLSIADRRSTIAQQVETKMAEMRKSLGQQYDQVFAFLQE